MKTITKKLPGIGLAAVIAVPAWFLGTAFPIVGSPVLGILLGMIVAFWKRPSVFEDGVKYTSKKLLQYAIILLGFGMNLYSVVATGSETLLLMCFTLTASFGSAYLFSRWLKVEKKTGILIGVGTSICGGSAIAAAAPVICADEEEVAHSISTIFLFNVIAAFLFPLLGHLLGMSDHSFGLWAGTAVNDTSSVVAAGYTYSGAAGDLAVVVKLTRTLMIIPVTLALAFYTAGQARKTASGPSCQRFSFVKIFPWFIVGFLLASLISTFLPLPAGIYGTLTKVGKFVIVMAMAAIGLNTSLVKLLKNGKKPILLGLICWAVLSVTSLLVQSVMTGV